MKQFRHNSALQISIFNKNCRKYEYKINIYLKFTNFSINCIAIYPKKSFWGSYLTFSFMDVGVCDGVVAERLFLSSFRAALAADLSPASSAEVPWLSISPLFCPCPFWSLRPTGLWGITWVTLPTALVRPSLKTNLCPSCQMMQY